MEPTEEVYEVTEDKIVPVDQLDEIVFMLTRSNEVILFKIFDQNFDNMDRFESPNGFAIGIEAWPELTANSISLRGSAPGHEDDTMLYGCANIKSANRRKTDILLSLVDCFSSNSNKGEYVIISANGRKTVLLDTFKGSSKPYACVTPQTLTNYENGGKYDVAMYKDIQAPQIAKLETIGKDPSGEPIFYKITGRVGKSVKSK